MAAVGFRRLRVERIHIEPRSRPGAALRSAPHNASRRFEAAGASMRKAGIEPSVFTYNLNSLPDGRCGGRARVRNAKALGAKSISTSTRLPFVAAFDAAPAHKMRVGLHNHSLLRPGDITTPENSTKRSGKSEYIGLTWILDTLRARLQSAEYLRANRSRIFGVHLKTEGQTRVRLFLWRRRYPIPGGPANAP